MTSVSGVGRSGAGGSPGGTRPVQAGGGFAISAGPPDGVTAGSAANPVSLAAILALQENADETVRDRAARRHGLAVLKLLTRLQSTLLGGKGDEVTLADLARLADADPGTDDPRLAEVLGAIRLRARVELARRGG